MTGVQTCALPICNDEQPRAVARRRRDVGHGIRGDRGYLREVERAARGPNRGSALAHDQGKRGQSTDERKDRSPSSPLQHPGENTTFGPIDEALFEGVADALLEARHELLALAEQAPLLDDPGPHSLLHPLDEDAILSAYLPVELEQLVEPARIRVGREEVVEEAARTLGA